LWSAAISSFGSQVTMVKDRTVSPTGDFQVSHRPARAMIFRSGSAIAYGCFDFGPSVFHS
jgi:hypothetical protein